MKKFIVAFIRMILWYEAQFWADRISFAGGLLAGTLISLVTGLVGGFGYIQAMGGVMFASIVFVVILFFASGIFYIGKRFGDRKPMMDILKEIEKD